MLLSKVLRCVYIATLTVFAVLSMTPVAQGQTVEDFAKDLKEIRTVRDVYLEKAKEKGVLDEFGLPKDSKCDTLLFTCLYSVGGGKSDPLKMEGDYWDPMKKVPVVAPTGKFFRRGAHNCILPDPKNPGRYIDNGSKSSISGDQLIGLCVWMAHNRRSDVALRVFRHGVKTGWNVGENVGGVKISDRTLILPDLQSLIAGIILRDIATAGKVSEKEKELLKATAERQPKMLALEKTVVQTEKITGRRISKGYQRHLAALKSYIRLMLSTGKGANPIFDPSDELSILKLVADSMPRNAVINSIYARILQHQGKKFDDYKVYLKRSSDVLLDEKLFAKKKLPSRNARKSFYLFERYSTSSDGKAHADWSRDPGNDEQFTGIDFIFAAYLLNEIKQADGENKNK